MMELTYGLARRGGGTPEANSISAGYAVIQNKPPVDGVEASMILSLLITPVERSIIPSRTQRMEL
jgi:hypothetical protein